MSLLRAVASSKGLGCIAVAALLAVGISFGQSTASLRGVVLDQAGAAIPGATVTLIAETGVTISIQTGPDGKFNFSGIEPGSYDLEAEVAGFGIERIRGIVASAGLAASVKGEIVIRIDVSRPPPPPPPPWPPLDTSLPPPLPPRTWSITLSRVDWRPVTFTEPVWNVWTERYASSLSFAPVKLQPGREYSLVVDLSALQYVGYESEGTYSYKSSASFGKWLDQNKEASSAPVKILVIPDRRFFAPQEDGQRVKELAIDLTRLRDTRKNGFNLYENAFDFLRTHQGDAPFSFGRESFKIRTRSNVGNGSIALSIWADGRPVDELLFPACVVMELEDPCTASPPTGGSLKGVDPTGHGGLPDAALHLVELSPHSLVGVFRCNTCGWSEDDYRTWEMDVGPAWLSGRLREVLELIGKARDITNDETVYNRAGQALYNIVFHSAEDPPAAKAFREFVASALKPRQGHEGPPSLFVRLLPEASDLIAVPLGLMSVDISDSQAAYLGFLVRLETPLELQDYSRVTPRISTWALLLPPPRPRDVSKDADPAAFREVHAAREPFEQWVEAFRSWQPNAIIFEDIDDYAEWIGRGDSDSTALLILSHHDKNGLYFNADKKVPALLSTNVGRKFTAPSFAIIDGCGTVQPGASEFVRELNLHGVASVIATSAIVDPVMAGEFLRIFANLLRDHKGDLKYTVSRARFDAVRALSKRKSGKREYSAGALLFMLLGNGTLRVRVPPGTNATVP
jgi:hypothetical protein